MRDTVGKIDIGILGQQQRIKKSLKTLLKMHENIQKLPQKKLVL